MRSFLLGLTAATTVVAMSPAVQADQSRDSREGVPELDHVFVLVLENHNSFTSFGSIGILDNPQAPHIQALAKKYNFAANYNLNGLYNKGANGSGQTLAIVTLAAVDPGAPQ